LARQAAISVAEGDQNDLAVAQTRYGLPDVLSLSDAYEDWRAVLRRPMPVRRALGVPGLMWALLHDRLSSELPFQSCEMCGQLLSGRSQKRFCGPEDNVGCYRRRKRRDRQRARHSTERRPWYGHLSTLRGRCSGPPRTRAVRISPRGDEHRFSTAPSRAAPSAPSTRLISVGGGISRERLSIDRTVAVTPRRPTPLRSSPLTKSRPADSVSRW
jgi:hypothetical protein